MFVITKNRIINLDLVLYISKNTENKALYFYFGSSDCIVFRSSRLENAFLTIQNCILYNNPSVSIAEFEA